MKEEDIIICAEMSTDDCDILYENITRKHYKTQDVGGNYRSNTMNCLNRVIRNHRHHRHHCTRKLTESEYPSYAAEELALFHKLQSGYMQYPIDNETQVPSGPVSSADPENASDSIDCQVIWTKRATSSNSDADLPARELDSIENSEAQPYQETIFKNCVSSENPMTKLKYDLVSSSTYLEETDERPRAVMENEPNKISSEKCEICQISIATKNDLKLHLLEHMNESKGRIDITRRSIAALRKLYYGDKHVGLKKLQNCSICQEVFLSRTDLWYHINITHPEGRPHQCKLCPKNYKKKSHLSRHALIHRNKK